jgi:hypothetical protein
VINIQLVQKVFLAQFSFSLAGVDPDGACQVLTDKNHLTPVFSALCVPLVGGASTEGNGKTDNETENGEQEGADCQRIYEFWDTGNECRPESDDCQGKYHFGKDRAVHAHEERPLGMLGHVTRADLYRSVAEPVSVVKRLTYKVVLSV